MIWFEVLFAFTAIGWGVWQLIDLQREKRKDAAKRAASETAGDPSQVDDTTDRE